MTAASPGEGQGATFVVRLPLLSSPQVFSSDVSDASQTLDLAGRKILLVEDEPDSRDLIVVILEDAGARLTAVASASEALNILSRDRFDILVSDVGLPDMDGYRLLQQVRQFASEQVLPAIALTAYAGEINRQTALASGYQQHLSKPIEPEALVLAVTELISPGKSQR